jgi:hypothetical protein
MPSFQITLSPSRRAAGRFIHTVRRSIQKALAEANKKTGLTQSDIARIIGVHRSVIHRQIKGREDISLGRIAELGVAMGKIPFFEYRDMVAGANADWSGHNLPEPPTQRSAPPPSTDHNFRAGPSPVRSMSLPPRALAA